MSYRRNSLLIALVMAGLQEAAPLYAQHSQKPLTNDDVIALVHKKLPESVIVSAIKAGPSKFDASTSELVRLNAAGVTEKELNAMLAASGKGEAATPTA